MAFNCKHLYLYYMRTEANFERKMCHMLDNSLEKFYRRKQSEREKGDQKRSQLEKSIEIKIRNEQRGL